MKVTWQKLEGVEVQVFQPDTPAKSAILFCPGFPGAGSTVFEQRHAGALTDEGFDVIVIHHKGTRINGGYAPGMINNSQRLQAAYRNRESHLGGGAAHITDWMKEPLVVLQTVGGKYDFIHVIGNSFGALSTLWSLTEPDAPIANVKSLLLYAGAQGMDDGPDGIMRIWKAEYINMPRIQDKVELNPAQEIVDHFAGLYKYLPRRVIDRLPESIRLTYLVVEKDEILRLYDTEAFDLAIGRRGKIVMDTVDHAWFDAGLLAHDTPNYGTQDLLNLIRG